MPSSGTGRLYRRPDGKYFVYLPQEVAKDSAFPLKIPDTQKSMPVSVEFTADSIIIKRTV